jgi:hypothetical protein
MEKITVNNISDFIANIKSNTHIILTAPLQYTGRWGIEIKDLENLIIEGVDNALIESVETSNNLFSLKGWLRNIKFKGLNIVHNHKSSTETVYSGIFSDNPMLNGLEITKCKFSCPHGHVNGVKLITKLEGFHHNINIHDNDFENIGRMGVEILNQNPDTVARLKNIEVNNNRMKNLGTLSPFGMGISVDGISEKTTISDNVIKEHINAGIEIIKTGNVESYNNIIVSDRPSSVGFSIAKDHTNNIKLEHNIVNTISRPLSVQRSENVQVKKNVFVGAKSVLFEAKESLIEHTVMASTEGAALILKGLNNTVQFSKLRSTEIKTTSAVAVVSDLTSKNNKINSCNLSRSNGSKNIFARINGADTTNILV